ncbi:MAG: hypothetical protein ACK55I_44805, partial [bacterium]
RPVMDEWAARDAAVALSPDSTWLTAQLAKLPEDARRAYAQGDFLYYHAKDPGKSVLARRSMACIMALCAGPFVEPVRIARVAGSSDWLVRAAIARNRGTPPNLLKKFDNDAHPVVRALAAAAEKIESRPGVETPAGEVPVFDPTRTTGEILKALEGKAGERARQTCAANPRSSEILLTILAKDKDKWVRIA